MRAELGNLGKMVVKSAVPPAWYHLCRWARPGAIHVFIACFPKSGSTDLGTVLSQATGFPFRDAVPFYGHNEQDLPEPALLRWAWRHRVTQQHVKGTDNNRALMRKYRVRPVVLTRNSSTSPSRSATTISGKTTAVPPVTFTGRTSR